jgi:serine/threonine protein kinase
MQALADHGIVHRDLKPAQILVFSGGGGWRKMHAKARRRLCAHFDLIA